MDLINTGKLIAQLRKSKGFTQKNVADRLMISAKTVSKWERGNGFPDVSLLNELSDLLGVKTETLLEGNIEKNNVDNGNVNKMKIYVCPECHSISTTLGNSELICCGKVMKRLEDNKADNDHIAHIEKIENDFYITFNHEMTKEHYISFIIYQCADRFLFIRLYPQQDPCVRFPRLYGGKLYAYCTKHGLMLLEKRLI